MKLILISLFAILFSASSNAQSLKYNGYYYAFADAHNDSSWHYLRFYPDGTVIEVNSIARPGKLMIGFKKDVSPNLFQGTYTITGNDLQFSLSDQAMQKVAFKGTISNNSLKLHSHSFVNGIDNDDTFQFVPIKGMQ